MPSTVAIAVAPVATMSVLARPCMICSSANSSGYQRSEKPRHTKRFSESLKLMITTMRIGR